MSLEEDSRTIWNYLRGYKNTAYILAAVSLLSAGIGAVVPYIYGRLIDLAIEPGSNLRLIFIFLGLWLIIALTIDILERWITIRRAHLSTDVENNFIVNGAAHILNLPLSFHKEKRVGEIMQRISRAANFLGNIVEQVVFDILPQFLTVIVAFAIMVFINIWLVSIIAISLIIYILLAFRKSKPLINSQISMQKSYDNAYGQIWDSVLNAQAVKSFTAEPREVGKYRRFLFDRAGSRYKRYIFLWEALNFWQRLITSLALVAVIGAGVFFLRYRIITPGEIVMFLGFSSRIFLPFGQLAQQHRTIRNGLTAIGRAEKILQLEPEEYDFPGSFILKDIKREIEFKNVIFAYPKHKPVLRGVSFKVAAGQVAALVGESGVGKTTLVDLISRYYQSQKGKILIDGHEINKINLRSLRERIAYVPQEISLFNDTIKNNIRYGKPNASGEKIIEAAKNAHADEFIQKFPKKYNQLVGQRGIKLSTGQKQRVAIARALLRDPRILILDEATASLDSKTEKLVQEALEKLIKNRTTFVIAHRLSTVRHADKILVLENGRIIEQGNHEELLRRHGVYQKLYSLQVGLK